ncbi:hypothetical protein [Neoaquamicrobium sediminum]|uniref:hypothetical protein n=1 Tax=Neoaquamicrobium sediminum TaxID=1849104 RepID=UPI00156507C1|nr:hypothetical protein [Mesorhizobium sediminum]NRC56198.1 hypothetical protein [Mesorhizobium sediminum]
MAITTTSFTLLQLLQDSSRGERAVHDSADLAFSALMQKHDVAVANSQTIPTPVPVELRSRYWNDAPTPPPATEFNENLRQPSPTPIPADIDDGSIRSDSPTPVPTVTPSEDAADLTHRLVHSLLTGVEFKLSGGIRDADDA